LKYFEHINNIPSLLRDRKLLSLGPYFFIAVEEIDVDKLVLLWIAEGLVKKKQATHLMSIAIKMHCSNTVA